MPRATMAVRLKGRANSVETRTWQHWFDEAAIQISRFDAEDDDDPFAYNETASVSLLCSAAARIGCLALAEFSVKKKHHKDGRRRSNGRADLWVRSDSRIWSFEFKQITYGTVTLGRLRERMAAADRCAGKLLRYGPEHMVSGLIVPLYYLDLAERAKARTSLAAFTSECDFAWHLRAPSEGPETFLFFNSISRPIRR